MPGFKIHITASTTLGIAYGAGAAVAYGVPLPTCALAATLCSVSGMLPDLDADGGTPLHESVGFAAAAVPIMLDDRFRQWGWTHESLILSGALIYLFIRFVLSHLLQHFTVHRGIFHSLPVALIFTEIAFLVCTTGEIELRYFKAGGVLLGFMSHLILDEIWSVDLRHFRLKSSFGTALKLWSQSKVATAAAYLLAAFTTLLVLHDPIWINVSPEAEDMHVIATRLIDQIYK